MVQIGADDLAVLHAETGVIDEAGHAPRRTDQIEGTVRKARLRRDDLDALFKTLLQHEDARQPRVGRGERNMSFIAIPQAAMPASCTGASSPPDNIAPLGLQDLSLLLAIRSPNLKHHGMDEVGYFLALGRGRSPRDNGFSSAFLPCVERCCS